MTLWSQEYNSVFLTEEITKATWSGIQTNTHVQRDSFTAIGTTAMTDTEK